MRLSIFPGASQAMQRRTSPTRWIPSEASRNRDRHRRKTGGGERDRTDDPLLAKQVLSQLSYTPMISGGGSGWTRTNDQGIMSPIESICHNKLEHIKAMRKLPHLRDKQKVEFSGRILPGGSNEEIAIYGKPDCWDIEGSR